MARKKIFPALFSLFAQGYLPESVKFYGFARSELSQEAFRESVLRHLTCRYTPDHSCERFMSDFLSRCHYVRGEYGARDSYLDLYAEMRAVSGGLPCDDVFYMAVPASVFVDVTNALGDAGMVDCDGSRGWTRVVIEKPFGRDRQSSDELNAKLHMVFSEEQIYRIDHYLGKEMLQNLMVLRFANQIFQPLWNAQFIESVDISWKEDIGTDGRGGYFDQYGIVRDVIQNHLTQTLALVAMEEPLSLSATDVRDRKVELLRHIPPVAVDDMVLGQYPEYLADPTVPAGSLTPTFAQVRLRVDNPRWQGVPFTITAGKGLGGKLTEIRMRFRVPPGNIFCALNACPPANELIIRVQPDEGVHFKIVNKVPGPKLEFSAQELDLSYKSAYAGQVIPEAYENLLLDVVHGRKGLFIREDELAAAWDIYTPALHELERREVVPSPYAFGSAGPVLTPTKCGGCGCGKRP